PTPFILSVPDSFPIFEQPGDNLMTSEGIDLGRHLFYDPILSKDSTMSCSSCHLPQGSFTDNLRVSQGVEGLPGTRSSMSLLNVGFHYNGFFWDGRSASLEEQALLPVEDPLELNAEWPEVITRLRRSEKYQEKFRSAFGITNTNGITRENTAKAIAQFERSLVSSGTSKYDKVLMGRAVFTDEELMGVKIFFDRTPDLPDGECFHCHSAPLLTNNEYMNNGLIPAEEFEDFTDKGLGAITGLLIDNGKFKVPTLRNIEFSAPYMHNGQFNTLEEVIDHYNEGGKISKGSDALIQPLGLTEEHKAALLAFLKTLNDEEFMTNPDYQDPNG
ncbi:MAG: cytochrome C peroxidase, partial [Saprospiraceae bacterium]|nr:cytochrome C peroxidase [Bacteroidia bacterium]NNL90635.1 cytochrome C peroxidase [Saprospiraceae bacterium]